MQKPSDVLDSSSPPGDSSSPLGDSSSPLGDSSSPLGDSSSSSGDSGLSVPQDLQVYGGPSGCPGPAAPRSLPGLAKPAGRPGPPRRLRQERTIYNKEQQCQLEKQFQMTKYLTYEDHKAIAERLGLKVHQVQVWFKNRRAKESRQQRQQQMKPLPRLRRSRALAEPSCPVSPGQVPAPCKCQPVFPATPGFGGLALPSSSRVFSAVNPAFCSYCRALLGQRRDSQKSIPAATATATWPQCLHTQDLVPHTASLPYYSQLLSPPYRLETPACPVGDGTVDNDSPGPRHYCMCKGSSAATPAGPAGPCTGHCRPTESPASPARRAEGDISPSPSPTPSFPYYGQLL